MQPHHDALQRRCDDYETQMKKLQSEIVDNEKEIGAHRLDRQKALDDCESWRGEHAMLLSKLQEVEKDLLQQQSRHAHLASEAERLQDALRVKDKMLDDQNDTIKQAKLSLSAKACFIVAADEI